MARRKTAEQIDAMIERFQASGSQDEPQKAESTEQVMLVKKTWLYGAMTPAGSLVTVPTTIANVLRAKGIVK